MNVTIQDAINAFALLRDSVNENGFLYECYNLGISALKTIQDGNYKLSTTNVSRETLEKIANFDCTGMACSACIYDIRDTDNLYACIRTKASDILSCEQKIKEVEQWITTHYQN